jgi:uncharacterized membrane-anchored protein YitT (DUF2179 family)
MKPYTKSFREFLFVLSGIFSASIGLKGFLLPNGFFDGGAMGIALLLSRFIHLDLSYFIIFVNLPFLFVGFRWISKEFAAKSALAIFSLALFVHWVKIPAITDDKFLISIFGGVFLGMGIGMAIRGGAVIDGTEALAVQVSRNTSLSVGDFITVFNVLLFCCVALLVNLETAMYSMITYVSASKSVDFLLNGVEEYIGVTVISPNNEKIRETLVTQLHRAVTVYKIQGGFGKRGEVHEDRKALFCVVTRLEVTRMISEIGKIDPEAFVVQHSIKDIRGGMIKKRPLH